MKNKIADTYELPFRKNETSGNIIIDIALDKYLEYFHEWDYAAYSNRDMHPELAHFLDICSDDIPLKKDIEIQFHIKTSNTNSEKENQIRKSYMNYYSSIYRMEQKKVKRFIRFSIVLLLIAFFLLSLYSILSGITLNNIVSKVLVESLLIGGWVFAWEAIHILFLDLIEPFNRVRALRRFLNADILFKYL